jgi:hypothetical protein
MGETAALTARDLLCDGPDELAAALEETLGEDRLKEALPQGMGGTVGKFLMSQAAAAIDRILVALEVDSLLMGGWMNLDDLRKAIEETGADGSSRHVALNKHTISSKHAPSLDATINGAAVKLVDLAVDLGFTLAAAELVVESGEVTGVELGSVGALGELKASGITVVRKESGRIDADRLFTKLRQ